MKQSAGLLLYRFDNKKQLEFLLVHPGGPFFAKKDAGFWTIPKGEIEEKEDPLKTAVREFREETGYEATGHFIPLGTVKQKAGKVIEAWGVAGDLDPALIRSNSFEIEWPPRSGKKASFPEIDKAGWFSYGEAEKKLNAAQLVFLDRLMGAVKPESL